MVTEVIIEGIKQKAITDDWFCDCEGIMKLRNSLEDVLEQCISTQETKDNVRAESLFYMLRIIKALDLNNEI